MGERGSDNSEITVSGTTLTRRGEYRDQLAPRHPFFSDSNRSKKLFGVLRKLKRVTKTCISCFLQVLCIIHGFLRVS